MNPGDVVYYNKKKSWGEELIEEQKGTVVWYVPAGTDIRDLPNVHEMRKQNKMPSSPLRYFVSDYYGIRVTTNTNKSQIVFIKASRVRSEPK